MALRTIVGQKTYSHLMAAKRVPTQYELVTSRLHYYLTHGVSVRTPVTLWYERYQAGSLLQADDWEAFADPAQTTYASYVHLRADREVYAAEVLSRAAEADRTLPDAWASAAAEVLGALRFPRHALMMTAGYVGSIAPSSRITAAAAFQMGDEVRHTHRLAERAASLLAAEDVARRSRAIWLTDAAWQPLRRLVEELLVTYDWGESFTALNLVVKPMLDGIATPGLSLRAGATGDRVTRDLLGSLGADASWHRSWTKALVLVALRQQPSNEAPLRRWIAEWRPRAEEAVTSIAPALGVDADAARSVCGDLLASCGLAGAA